MADWINVKDRLPKGQKPVIVYVPPYSDEDEEYVGHVAVAYYTQTGRGGYWAGTDGNAYGAIGIIHDPTHWMELPEPPKGGESGILDYKAVECLKAVQTITKYLDDEEQYCGCTYWIDRKGYSFSTDIGYFFEGLEEFEGYLIKRLRRAVIGNNEAD